MGTERYKTRHHLSLSFYLQSRKSARIHIPMRGEDSKVSSIVTMRMPNEDLELLDVMVEAGGFRSRSECLRAFVKPVFEMAKDAMVKKKVSIGTVGIALTEYKELTDHLSKMAKQSKVHTTEDLLGGVPQLRFEATT